MAQLSFDYDSRSNESVAYVGGHDASDAAYRVRMVQDCDASNPFEDEDGHWPMIVNAGRRNGGMTDYDKCKGPSLDRPFDRFSDGQLIRLQGKICDAIGGAYYCPLTGKFNATIQDDWQAHKRDYREQYVSGRDGFAAMARDYFSDALAAVSDSDRLETLSALYDLLGIPNLCTSSHGYSQGDYAELLIVATPEAMAEFGWNKADRRDAAKVAADMQAQAYLYSAWAWGDVYGFIAERAPVDQEDREDSDAWEEIDSCWGFYGDADKSGLSEAALAAIEYDKRQCKIARAGKLKELIRANAPLAARAAVLGAMPC